MSSTEFDLSEWGFLPPLDLDSLPDEPPPERDSCGGVTLGSDLGSIGFTDKDATDLGHAVDRGLADVRPGLVELARLGSLDCDELNAIERVDALIAVGKQQAWLEARKQELLAAISTKDSSDKHWCIEEVGAALGLSGAAARTRLANAEQLVARLPETLSALSNGTISGAQATAITETSFVLADELLPAFETRVLARADEQSLAALKRTAKRAVLTLDPTTAQQKRERAIADRYVRISPSEDGMAWLLALLPAADVHAIYARLDGAARARADDERTMDQLRADALIHGVLTGIDGKLPTEQGRRPAINVTVSLNTLLGKNDPGWLDGYGPIDADHARELAHDPTGTWRRLITDPVGGQPLDYGTTRYRPPQHLIDHVIARDGECTFPSALTAPGDPIWTTSSRTRPGRPALRTCNRCTEDITTPRPRPDGRRGVTTGATPTGPARRAGRIARRHRNAGRCRTIRRSDGKPSITCGLVPTALLCSSYPLLLKAKMDRQHTAIDIVAKYS